MIENKKLWESVLLEVEMNLSKASFKTWFKDTYIVRQEEGEVLVSVPNPFVKDWLMTKYHKFILKSLRNYGDHVRSVGYIVSKDGGKHEESAAKPQIGAPNYELPLNDFYINKEDNLNPRYTFETFVVGPFNDLAHAASQAIIATPGMTYNPLFVYGNTGFGKTHLIQSIGNQIKMNFKDKRVYYITSEKFALDYINSVQTNKTNMFKEKYRKYDVLIMDDIQFLSGKEKTQEELFHLFNTLYDNNRQIIFSSDKHPNFIPNLEDRLKSRFSAGMIVDIQPPDRDSRAAIIKTKANKLSFQLDPETVDFLADNIESNIREIEGILNTINCQAQLKSRPLNLLELKNLLKNNARPKKSVSVKDIIKIVSGFYNVDENSIYEKTRRKEVVKPRQLIMYILREEYSISYPTIGQKLGGRDHTTVIHSCEKVKNDLKTNHVLAQELSQIKALI
jgi:chromosomal replication initiator protein